jgi:hypothetical protein
MKINQGGRTTSWSYGKYQEVSYVSRSPGEFVQKKVVLGRLLEKKVTSRELMIPSLIFPKRKCLPT